MGWDLDMDGVEVLRATDRMVLVDFGEGGGDGCPLRYAIHEFNPGREVEERIKMTPEGESGGKPSGVVQAYRSVFGDRAKAEAVFESRLRADGGRLR